MISIFKNLSLVTLADILKGRLLKGIKHVNYFVNYKFLIHLKAMELIISHVHGPEVMSAGFPQSYKKDL